MQDFVHQQYDTLCIKRRKTLGLQSNSIKVAWRHFQPKSSSGSPWNHHENIYLVGGWTNPIWTILVSQIGSFLQFLGVKSKNIIEVLPPICETPWSVSQLEPTGSAQFRPPFRINKTSASKLTVTPRYQRSKHPVMVQDQQDTLAPTASVLPLCSEQISCLVNFGYGMVCHLAKSRLNCFRTQDVKNI